MTHFTPYGASSLSMTHFDCFIIGSSLYGAVFAHGTKEAGMWVLVVEKRPHIAGNTYTEDLEGIYVHRYGAHSFHTNNRNV